jgi:hypothetical protein
LLKKAKKRPPSNEVKSALDCMKISFEENKCCLEWRRLMEIDGVLVHC